MSKFVRVWPEGENCRSSLVNLDDVVQIIGDLDDCGVKLRNGDVIRGAVDLEDDVADRLNASGVVIPALPGYDLIRVEIARDYEPKIFEVTAYPIIGWRTPATRVANSGEVHDVVLAAGQDINVLEDTECGPYHFLVRDPNGRCAGHRSGPHATLDEALDAIFRDPSLKDCIYLLDEYRAARDATPAPEESAAPEAAPVYRPTSESAKEARA